ncbi:MAG TPA: cupin domain-containing protein [Gaiellaceae bacterium]|nr:cupin domain-containing protein [Gaiellaceae bacterium]
MAIFNVFGEQDWDECNDRAGYQHRATVIGERLGASLLGGTLYEVPPGEKTWPYHYELGCEEWLISVSGRPTLRTPEGERELEPGDVAVFPEGPDGAHQVINRSDEPARVVIFSSKSPLVVVHYPDSGKVGLWSQGEGYQAILRNEPKLDYWEGEDEGERGAERI